MGIFRTRKSDGVQDRMHWGRAMRMLARAMWAAGMALLVDCRARAVQLKHVVGYKPNKGPSGWISWTSAGRIEEQTQASHLVMGLRWRWCVVVQAQLTAWATAVIAAQSAVISMRN